MPHSDPFVRADHLSRTYRLGRDVTVQALLDASFQIQRGEFIALVGPSGSGKSTLLNLIGGLDRPTSGTLFVDGQDIARFSDQAAARYRQKTVGMVFQSFNLLQHFTALHNVMVPGLLAGRPVPESEKRGRELLHRLGLDQRLVHRPAELSGGEQQRVALARALVNKPAIILSDEPTGNLDTKTGAEVMRLLQEVCRQDNTTLIVVTHDERIAQAADRIVHLLDGKTTGEPS